MRSIGREECLEAVQREGSQSVIHRVGVVILGYFIYLAAVAMLPLGARAHASAGERIDGRVRAGQLAWRNNACTSCHSIYGLGGHTGPDLTNAYSRVGEGYIRVVLEHGVRAMPALALSEDEIHAIIAYLRHADATGVYPAPNAFVSAFGEGR